ncbi:transposase [Sphingomonas panacis]|uniref:transposase n=1 Tax=Sphingomonas panacis TaxID=1560345 RepID=UPI0014713836|nr:transposase [Sphingomonas panacis]
MESCFSRTFYKGRNAIGRMFCRLEDCDASQPYDRIARNFLGAIHLAAAIMW